MTNKTEEDLGLAKKYTGTKAIKKGLHFHLQVNGTYYSGKEGIKNYSIGLYLNTLDKPLSIIKNNMLDKLLKQNYADYDRYQTYYIHKTTPLGEGSKYYDLALEHMDLEELRKYVKTNKIKINGKLYLTSGELLARIRESRSNSAEQFKVSQDAEEATRALLEELTELNPALLLG